MLLQTNAALKELLGDAMLRETKQLSQYSVNRAQLLDEQASFDG